VALIIEYERCATNEGEELEKENVRLIDNLKKKELEQTRIKPELDRLTKIVDDQAREHKNLQENIKLFDRMEEIEKNQEELRRLEKEKSGIEGADTAEEDMKKLIKRENGFIADIGRLEGRRAEIVDAIRGVKRKLSQSEYRNVDEDYRVASIKHDTTEMAVKDIEKYHSALDKALQRYHSLKIIEINTIIRDLWNLTYKGEDISNIEIVSGQEPGSRSSRSYNYR
jgi:DNA repair protein RAD50